MKCPMCGDEIVNGRCRFCGYVPTKEDMDAIAKWELQKSQIKREAGPVDFTPKRRKPKAAGTKTVKVRRSEKPERKPTDSKDAAKFFEPEPAPDRARKPVREKKALGINLTKLESRPLPSPVSLSKISKQSKVAK